MEMRITWSKAVTILGVFAFLSLWGGEACAQQQEVPTVSADVGSCRALFTVQDGSNKPIYNAKIEVTIRYGFMSVRKTQLEVATNSDGKALVTGLPNSTKKPLEFVVRSGTVSKVITDDTGNTCDAKFDATLTVH